MTKEEAKKNAEVMIAWSEGKVVQWRNKGYSIWLDGASYFNFHHVDYRIKPTLTYSPWTFDEFPVGITIDFSGGQLCLVIAKHNSDNDCHNPHIHFYGSNGVIQTYTIGNINATHKCSYDFGKTWQPCGVLVNE